MLMSLFSSFLCCRLCKNLRFFLSAPLFVYTSFWRFPSFQRDLPLSSPSRDFRFGVRFLSHLTPPDFFFLGLVVSTSNPFLLAVFYSCYYPRPTSFCRGALSHQFPGECSPTPIEFRTFFALGATDRILFVLPSVLAPQIGSWVWEDLSFFFPPKWPFERPPHSQLSFLGPFLQMDPPSLPLLGIHFSWFFFFPLVFFPWAHVNNFQSWRVAPGPQC